MKKLKFLAFLMMGIIACLGINSCGDNDDDEPSGSNSSIVGTWEGGNVRYEYEGLSITFRSDSTGSYTEYNHGIPDESTRFGYKISHDFILMVDLDEGEKFEDGKYDGQYETYRFSINKGTLHIYDFLSENWILKRK